MTINKRVIAGLTLAAMLGIGVTGCKQTATQAASSDVQQAQTEKSAKAKVVAKSSHLCGAITKAGKPCTRRVSNGDGTDSAVEAKCWQHVAGVAK